MRFRVACCAKAITVAFFVVAAIALSAANAGASSIYYYTGLNYDYTEAPYTTAMRVSGSVTLATPLAANMAYQSVNAQVVDFAFSDGVRTLDSSLTYNGFGFWFQTDSLGNISQWFVDLTVPTALGENIIRSATFWQDYVVFGSDPVFGSAYTNPGAIGRWASPPPLAPVPEPSTFFMLATGAAVLAVRHRRRSGYSGYNAQGAEFVGAEETPTV